MKLFATFPSSQAGDVTASCFILLHVGGSGAPPCGSFSISLPSIGFYTVLELCCQPEGFR